MDMNEAVAKAISAERSIAGMTVKELAAEAGIPERSLMRVLQAERDIKVNQVEQIANALRLYPHEIIEHAETILERSRREAPPQLVPLNVPTSVEDLDVREPRTMYGLAASEGEIAADEPHAD